MKQILLLGLLLVLGIACQNTQTETASAEDLSAVEGVVDTIGEAAPEAAVESSGSDRKNIVDYYKLLNEAGLIPGEYPLIKQDGRWISISPLTEEASDAIVDISNGFIEITDDGTGGGTFQVQVVLFRMEDGQAVLGVNGIANDGVTVYQTYAFYREQDGSFQDWTEHTMPVLNAFDFLPDDYAEEPDIVAEAIDVYFELPRKGTQVNAQAWTGKKAYLCNEDASERQKIACGVIGRLERTSFTLNWNRKEGRFN